MGSDNEDRFDVFLSHAHVDAEIVEQLAARLEDDANIRVWLDRWVLVPGEHWQQEMARGLDQAATCAVCIGTNTPSGWYSEEIQRALNRQTKDRSFRVIPVILPNGDRSVVDDFLELRTWVEFQEQIDADGLHVLVSGIRGVPPGRRNRPNAQCDDGFTAVKQKLTRIRSLRTEDLIDDDVALEYQRRLLDELMEAQGLS